MNSTSSVLSSHLIINKSIILPTRYSNMQSSSASTPLFLFGTYENKLYIGMALALGGNLLISVSLSIQKKVHNRLGQDSQTKYCLDKWWWLGMALMGIGEVGNFLAYGFAPASLVAPLGSVAVIANTIIAAIFLHEPLTMPSMMGVSLVVVGAVTLVSFSPMSKPVLTSAQIISYLKAWPFLLYISIETLILSGLLCTKYKKKNEHIIILLLLVALIGSVTIIAAKALSTLLSESILQGKAHFLNPVFWVSLIILPITTIAQIRFLNRAMQLYDVSDVVPVNFIFFTLSAILAGAMFYQEFYGVYFDRIFMFIFGCLQSFVGVAIITQQKEYKNGKEGANSSPSLGAKNGNSEVKKPESFAGDSSHLPDIEENCSFNTSALYSSSTRPVFKTLAGAKGHCGHNALNCRNKSTSRKDFYKTFIKSVKSTESLCEVQPLLENKKRTVKQYF